MDDLMKFNYQGIDSKEKHQIALSNLERLEDSLREIYMERINMFSKESFEQNAEPFRFSNKDNCSIVLFILPYEFNNSHSVQYYFLSTPHQRNDEVHVLTHEQLSDLDTYAPYAFLRDKILPLYGYEETQIIEGDIDLYNNLPSTNNIFTETFKPENFFRFESLKRNIIQSISSDIGIFKKSSNTRLSYFAKDVHKFPFSILDLKPLVTLVNDDDFTYQLDQAMAAYHENLFLPCAATLGVVLETLCIKILEGSGMKKIKSGDTQLGKLRERLISEDIITRRDNTRLEVAYKMRNMVSHTSQGITLKEDCHFMLNVINAIAFEYLTVN